MKIYSSFLYARKLMFSSGNFFSNKNTLGKKSLMGAVLCIGLSLVPLVAILSVSNSMICGMTSRIIQLSSHHIQVSVSRDSIYSMSAQLLQKGALRLESIDGVRKSYGEVQSNALAVANSFRSGAVVRGVDKNIFSSDVSFSSLFKVVEGTTSLDEKKSCVLGQKIAGDLKLHAGDTVRIVTVQKNESSVTPRVASFKVSGIVSSGYQELDALWFFISVEDAFECLSSSSVRCIIGLDVNSPFSSDFYLVTRKVSSFLFGDENFADSYALGWNDVNVSEFENFASTKALLLVVTLLILLVASINISSALIMIVLERKSEIAILKSMGQTSGGIVLSFLISGFFAGLGGVAFGIPCGLLCSVFVNEIIVAIEWVVNLFSYAKSFFTSSVPSSFHLLDPAYYLQYITVEIPWTEIIFIMFGTLILSVLVSIVPAIRAGREKIVDTLRKS